MSILQLLRKPAQDRLPRVLRAMETLIMNEQVKHTERDRELDYEYDHIREAVKYAKSLALKRKIDPDIAGTVAAVQNIASIVTGRNEDHADAGYYPAKEFLKTLDCFSAKEIEQIAVAVRNHSRKSEKDAPLDELAKDADIYARYCQGHEFSRPHDLARLSRLRIELEF
ncbi:MAG: HD domain-containing protein [Armatimonadota bacterium]|nr:HD domain-containing protein [Armatimonadota bacterium]